MSDRFEKLKPEEKSLYRRVYLARVHEGASVESADRQAMQAVKIWHDRGAFGEIRETAEIGASDFGPAWEFLAQQLARAGYSELNRRIATAMVNFDEGSLDLDDFKRRVSEIVG